MNKRLERVFEKSIRREMKHDMLSSLDNECVYCFNKLTYKTATFEHKMPKLRGGSDERKNLTISCQRCNSIKGTMTDGEFRKRIKNFSTSNVGLILLYIDRRLNLQLKRSVKNLNKMFGFE